MKVAYFINTFKSDNWGGQATSNGIKYLLKKTYPEIEFTPIDLPTLPFRRNRFLRKLNEHKLKKAILSDSLENVKKCLVKMNIPLDIFNDYTHICFNGEGAVHYKSGHLIRFLGLLFLAKKTNKFVASINQTIDLNNDKSLEELVSIVYNLCDFVSVREPISYRYCKKIGIKHCQLIPDAVYGLEKLDENSISNIIKKHRLTKSYITVTGSSFLKRNKRSLEYIEKILYSIKEVFPNHEIIFMNNAKTDYELFKKFSNIFKIRIFSSSDINYKEAIAIISKSDFLIGGRQHPNIFAFIYKVPYLPFVGNTFKNEGVAELQGYELNPLSYNDSRETIISNLNILKNSIFEFKDIKLNKLEIFKEE